MDLSREQLGVATIIAIVLSVFGVYHFCFPHKAALIMIEPREITKDTIYVNSSVLIQWDYQDYKDNLSIYFVSESDRSTIIYTIITDFKNKPNEINSYNWVIPDIGKIQGKRGFIKIVGEKTVFSDKAFSVLPPQTVSKIIPFHFWIDGHRYPNYPFNVILNFNSDYGIIKKVVPNTKILLRGKIHIELKGQVVDIGNTIDLRVDNLIKVGKPNKDGEGVSPSFGNMPLLKDFLNPIAIGGMGNIYNYEQSVTSDSDGIIYLQFTVDVRGEPNKDVQWQFGNLTTVAEVLPILRTNFN